MANESSVEQSPQFAPLSDVLGVEVTGVDLSAPVDGSTRDQIKDALERGRVIVVRDQKLSNENLIAFTELLGPIERNYVKYANGATMEAVHEVSNLDENGKPSSKPYQNSNFYWHSDKSYRQKPTFITILFPVALPPDGGETQFADLTKAYEALPEDMKKKIADYKVVHNLEYMRTKLDARALTAEEKSASPEVEHPLVRSHPVTGAKSLYLGIYCSHIVGLPVEEGRALLDQLLEHATQPQFVYSHQWKPADVIAWDNRWLLHRAVSNFEMDKHPRIMRRTVVAGTEVPQ